MNASIIVSWTKKINNSLGKGKGGIIEILKNLYIIFGGKLALQFSLVF